MLKSTSSSLLLFDSVVLEKESYLQQWRVLCWTVILFKQNSFDASLKPHYNHDGAKWTVIDVVCSQLVRGGGGTQLLAQSAAWLHIFIFISFSFPSLRSVVFHCPPPHPTPHTVHTVNSDVPVIIRASLFGPSGSERHLTRQAGPQLLLSNKHIRALRADGLYRHEVKNRAVDAPQRNKRAETMT